MAETQAGRLDAASGERLVLGIETSCDETAAAVVRRRADGGGEILSDVVLSQLEAHAPYGGVVPEIAARAHVETLDGVIGEALARAGLPLRAVDAVAGTAGPGLIGGLIVGLTSAKALALAAQRPFLAVNHLEGHALTARLTDGLAFPYLLLLVSGGHSQILAVEGVGRYARLGTTVDDALGEAFDKAAKLLGLGYPGGPEVEARARIGDPARFALPRPMLGREGCDFSFSGLKTALRQEVGRLPRLGAQDVADLCAGFQAAVVDVLADRTVRGLEAFAGRAPGAPPVLVVAGGVGANRAVRAALEAAAARFGARIVVPPPRLCIDNAAMIAWAGAERLALGQHDPLTAPARPRWPLDQSAALPGAKA